METTVAEKAPEVITLDQVASELEFGVKDEIAVLDEVKPEINAQADDIVSKIMSISDKDLKERQKFADAIQKIGSPIQEKLSKQSQMLKVPMTTLINDAEDGGAVAKDLLSLQEKVSDINPNRVDFTMGSLRRLLSKIPGVGTPIANWFAKYQAVDSVINDIVASLKDGKAQLQRDNTTLRDDQTRMRELTFQLEDYIQFAQVLDKKIEQAAKTLEASDQEKSKFLEEELLFPLKQRIMDLQQQRAVNQQGVLATEVIVRNNKELVTGVDRALNVTITALNTAATLQVALQRQRKVLEGVQAVTDTTNELIAGTAEQLKTQGVEIQKQAAQAQLDIDVLRRAFSDVEAALEDISQFRRNALPQMAKSITEMDVITGKMESAIQKMEKGNKVSDQFTIELSGHANNV